MIKVFERHIDHIVDRHSAYLSALVIVVISSITYGLFLLRLGVYWDEALFMWVANVDGASGLVDAMGTDRPAVGTLWGLEYSIIGSNILLWHIWGLITRIGSGLAVLWLFHELLPGRKMIAFTAGLLFTIYPGFSQQPIAFMYQLTFIVLILSNVSLAATVRSHRHSNYWLWLVIGLGALIFEVLLIEYFLGLELLRILLLWYISKDTSPKLFSWQRLITTGRRWLPYMALSIMFLIWRVIIFSPERSETDVSSAIFDRFKESPFEALAGVPLNGIRDFFETVIFAWFTPTYIQWNDVESVLLQGLALVVATIVMIVFGVYVYLVHRSTHDEDTERLDQNTALTLAGIGVVAFFGSIFFVLLSDRNAHLANFDDRYTLPGLLCAIFVVVGLLYSIPNLKWRLSLTTLLIGLAVIAHVVNTNDYRHEWQSTTDMWWQAAWRMPQIEDDTIILIDTDEQTFRIQANHTVWSTANHAFKDEVRINLYGEFLDAENIDNLRRSSVISGTFRHLNYQVDYGNIIIISYKTDGCLHVMDGQRLEMPEEPSGNLLATAPYSDIERILVSAESIALPTHYFGTEPTHNWCYYYQKADLARQMEDYEQINILFEEANSRGLAPSDLSEWYPFIEGFVMLNQTEVAQELMDSMIDNDPFYSVALCQMVSRLGRIDEYTNLECILP